MDEKGYVISGLSFLPTFFQRKKVDQKISCKIFDFAGPKIMDFRWPRSKQVLSCGRKDHHIIFK